MNFDNKKIFLKYLENLKEIGAGSQGVVYHDKKNNKAIKVYDSCLDYDGDFYDEDEILRFGPIQNATYIFPEEVVTVNDKVIGYISKYVNGKSLYKTNPLLIKLDNFSCAMNDAINNIKLITAMAIATYDVMYNIMYGNNKFHIIDTDEYSYSHRDYSVLLKHNNFNFDVSIKYFLIDNLFDEFVENNKLLKEMYDDVNCSSLDFLRVFRNLLSEYSDQNINKLQQAKQYVNKKSRPMKFIRL